MTISDSMRSDILRMREHGAPYPLIARQVGRSLSTVREVCRTGIDTKLRLAIAQENRVSGGRKRRTDYAAIAPAAALPDTWPEDRAARIAIVRRLVGDGETDAAIASRFGVSRNTIIGIRSRAGIVRCEAQSVRSPAAKVKAPAGGKTTATVGAPVRAAPPPVVRRSRFSAAHLSGGGRSELAAIEDASACGSTNGAPVVSPAPVRILEHRAGQCRWPLGDPRLDDFRYCGNSCRPCDGAEDGYHSYCDGHREAARRRKSGPKPGSVRPSSLQRVLSSVVLAGIADREKVAE
jgi:GcrA cell cycle regulator